MTGKDRRRRRPRRAARVAWPWIGVVPGMLLLIIVLSRCIAGMYNQIAPHPAADPRFASHTPDAPSSTTPDCDYYAGPDDPTYMMRDGFIDWGTYWGHANAYALQRTAHYTPDEQTLAKAIWSEQKTYADTRTAAAARRQAMIAIGYVVLHRRDMATGWFSTTNTLDAVLNDTRQDIQFQGYWRWRDQDVVHDYLLHKVDNGQVVQPGIGWESPDRALWFEALDVARGVLRGCEPDTLPQSLFFRHGNISRQIMEQRAQTDSSFVYHSIVEADLWLANQPFRW